MWMMIQQTKLIRRINSYHGCKYRRLKKLYSSLCSDSKNWSRKWDFRDRTTIFLISSNKRCLEPTIRPISVDQTKGTNTAGIRCKRDNLWNFPISFTHKGGTRKLVCRRLPMRKSYVRKSERSKEIGIEAWKDIEFSSRAERACMWLAVV